MLKKLYKPISILCLLFTSLTSQAHGCKGMEACDLSFTLTPTFGTMCEDTTQTRIFTVQNNSPVTMPLKFIKVVNANGTSNPEASIGTAPLNNCGTSLAAGASCNIAVNVTPVNVESFNLLLQVGTGTTQGTLSTPITLSAIAGCNVAFDLPLPTFTDSCSSLTESQTFTITNNTPTPLPIGTISFLTLPGDTYHLNGTGGTVTVDPTSTCLTSPLGPHASCTVIVDVNNPIVTGNYGVVDRLLQVPINSVTLAAPINMTVDQAPCTFVFSNPLPLPVNMACNVTQVLTYIVKNNTTSTGNVASPTLNYISGLVGTASIDPSSTCLPSPDSLLPGDTCTVVVDLFEACSGSGTINEQLQVTTPNPATLLATAIDITVTAPPPPPPPPVDYLGGAANCAVLGSSTVTNTGPSVVTGDDICLSPGSAVTGFPPGTISGGTIEINTTTANTAQTDLGIAITNLLALPCNTNLTGTDLGTLAPLTAGVYCFNTSAQLTGTVTLTGSSTDVFVFQIGSTLTTATSSQVVLVGVNPANVYWVEGTSATIGVSSQFQGNILAKASVTMNTSASLLNGRALANTGAVTLDSNLLTAP